MSRQEPKGLLHFHSRSRCSHWRKSTHPSPRQKPETTPGGFFSTCDCSVPVNRTMAGKMNVEPCTSNTRVKCSKALRKESERPRTKGFAEPTRRTVQSDCTSQEFTSLHLLQSS